MSRLVKRLIKSFTLQMVFVACNGFGLGHCHLKLKTLHELAKSLEIVYILTHN